MQQLRLRAEKRRDARRPLILPDEPEQLQGLIQELQIHQLELEMQYEEVVATQNETESLRARYLDLFDFAPVGYVTLDVMGMVQELNLHGAKLLGTTRHRLTNRQFLQFVAPASREAFLRLMIDVLASTEEPMTLDVNLVRDDNSTLRVRLNGISLPDPHGTRLCRLALTDLTPEFHATAAREQGEARFQMFLANSPDGMVLLRHHHIIGCNPAAVQLLGATEDQQLIGRHVALFAPPTQPDGRASRAAAEEQMAAAIRTGHARFEWLAKRLDTGAETWQEVTLTPLATDGPALTLATWRDLSTRKRREQTKRATDDLLNLTLQAAECGLWTWDPTADRLYLDERAQYALLGPDAQPSAPATLATLLDALHPDDRSRAERDITGALYAPSPVELNWRAVWPDGSKHFVATLGHAVCEDQKGKPLCFNGLVREVPQGQERCEDERV